MPDIRPVSDLRKNYKKLEKDILETGGPIFLTSNGRPSMVVMSNERYDAMVEGRPFQATQVTADGEFGKILKNLREVLNISERGMASAVEMPLEVYREMENGTVLPDKDVLRKLAEKLHVEESTLSLFTDHTNSMRGPLRKLLEAINRA